MKPRIRRGPFGGWVCYGKGVWGGGDTPSEAYAFYTDELNKAAIEARQNVSRVTALTSGLVAAALAAHRGDR